MSSAPWAAPSNTSGLIFDCDGTLADTMPIHLIGWRAMLAEHGMVFPEGQFYGFAGMPSNKIIAILANEQGKPKSPEAIAKMVVDKEHRYVEKLSEVTPIAVVLDIASRYRGVLPMAVASGGEGWVVRKTLQVIGALDWFQAVVGAEDTERHKPEPDVFLEAARRIGVDPKGCIVFEDSDLGMQAAQSAGMLGIDIRPWVKPSA